MKRNRVWRLGIAALGAFWLAGCTPSQPSSVAPTPAASATATPQPTAPPPQIAAQVAGGSVTLFGKNGEKVANLKFEAAGYDPKSVSSTFTVSKAKATLYDKAGKDKDGKDKDGRDAPAAELTADVVTGDHAKRTLTATGNATIRSLTEKGTPTIRADRMVWSFDERTVKGDGNVLATTQDGVTIPGRAFFADMHLRTFHLTGDRRPATVTAP